MKKAEWEKVMLFSGSVRVGLSANGTWHFNSGFSCYGYNCSPWYLMFLLIFEMNFVSQNIIMYFRILLKNNVAFSELKLDI